MSVLAYIFVFPWRRPCDYHEICCIDGKTIKCLSNPCSMYLSIFNSFRVIRCLSQCVSAKTAIFTIFLFPLGDVFLGLWPNILHEWMERQFNACKCLAAPIYMQQFPSYSNRKCKKNSYFRIPQPTFLFFLETPLRLKRNVLHGWKDNWMLTYLSVIVPELYDA